MATPVVTVASGGLPVVDVTATTPKLGLPVTEALAGRGMAVTKVAGGGMPVTYSTVADYPPAAVVPGTEAAAFLARTSGLSASYTNGYAALINGMVSAAVWPKFDVLHIYRAPDSATARLNLISASFPATPAGGTPPIFVPNSCYDNTAGLGYLNTGFDPNVAPTPKYGLLSAHLSFWSLTAAATAGHVCGCGGPPFSVVSPLISTNTILAINGNAGISAANANGIGHYIASRTGVTQLDGYKAGVNIVTSAANNTSTMPSGNFHVLGVNLGGSSPSPQSVKGAAFSAGAGLTAAEALSFHTLLNTFMSSVP